jgi:hypothetical protein
MSSNLCKFSLALESGRAAKPAFLNIQGSYKEQGLILYKCTKVLDEGHTKVYRTEILPDSKAIGHTS